MTEMIAECPNDNCDKFGQLLTRMEAREHEHDAVEKMRIRGQRIIQSIAIALLTILAGSTSYVAWGQAELAKNQASFIRESNKSQQEFMQRTTGTMNKFMERQTESFKSFMENENAARNDFLEKNSKIYNGIMESSKQMSHDVAASIERVYTFDQKILEVLGKLNIVQSQIDRNNRRMDVIDLYLQEKADGTNFIVK